MNVMKKKIKELLLYHKITKVNENTLELDNGTILEIEANKGGEKYIRSK